MNAAEVEGFQIEVKELTQAIPPRVSGRMSLALVAAGVGLLIAGLAVKEGMEAWRGEGCCVASPIPGEPAACEADCCAH